MSKVEKTEDELMAEELDKLLSAAGMGSGNEPKPDGAEEVEEVVEDDGEAEDTPLEAPETAEKDAEVSDHPEKETDGSEEILVKDEAAEEPANELPDLNSRLEQVSRFIEPQPEQGSLKEQVQQFEAQIIQESQALQSVDLASQLPKTDAYFKDGKWVFMMDEPELNDYLINLKDNGKEFLASKVERDYWKAVDMAEAIEARKRSLETNVARLQNAKDYLEWTDVREEVRRALPEISEAEFQQAAACIEAASKQNPLFAASLTNKRGKLQAGIQALQQVGAFERLRTLTSGAQIKTPSTPPDARAGSKKVVNRTNTGKPTYQANRLKGMSQDAFNKMSDNEVDDMLAAMFEGRIVD